MSILGRPKGSQTNWKLPSFRLSSNSGFSKREPRKNFSSFHFFTSFRVFKYQSIQIMLEYYKLGNTGWLHFCHRVLGYRERSISEMGRDKLQKTDQQIT